MTLLVAVLFFCVLMSMAIEDARTGLVSVVGVTALGVLAIIQHIANGTVGSGIGDVLGGWLAFGSLYWLSYWVYKQPMMGDGDVWLMGVLGGFFGLAGLAYVALWSGILCSGFGLGLLVARGRCALSYRLPFVPFIFMASVGYWLWVA